MENHYEELCLTLRRCNVRFSCEEFVTGINYYRLPEDILTRAKFVISILDGHLIFDENGVHIAHASGDELPSWGRVT